MTKAKRSSREYVTDCRVANTKDMETSTRTGYYRHRNACNGSSLFDCKQLAHLLLHKSWSFVTL